MSQDILVASHLSEGKVTAKTSCLTSTWTQRNKCLKTPQRRCVAVTTHATTSTVLLKQVREMRTNEKKQQKQRFTMM